MTKLQEDRNIEIERRFFEAKESMGVISLELGISRNAVAGVIHRIRSGSKQTPVASHKVSNPSKSLKRQARRGNDPYTVVTQ